jgi:hypothetical protein
MLEISKKSLSSLYCLNNVLLFKIFFEISLQKVVIESGTLAL